MTTSAGNLVLVLVNASKTRRDVDIRVEIDGKAEAEATLPNEVPGSPVVGIPPNRWFEVQVVPGPHALVATSVAGGARLEHRLEVGPKKWVLLMYGDPGEGQFSITIQDVPIRFQ